MRDGPQDENLTSTKKKKKNMSQQQIITFRLVMTYVIALSAMNSSRMAKL